MRYPVGGARGVRRWGVVRKSERYELVYSSHIAYMIYIYTVYVLD